MKLIKHKCIKFLFVLVCVFFLNNKINAVSVCQYDINDDKIPYISLTADFSESIEIESKAGFIDNLDHKYVSCNGAEIPYGIPYIIYNMINLIKIITPIILIFLGMLDFGKAVIANDEKNMKGASSKFIRRTIAAVIIFFVVAIVQFVFNQIVSDNQGAMRCINCFINDDCNLYEKGN